MGQCLKICEGTFSLRMVDFTAISGQFLMLDQFSQRRKMRLERTNLGKIIAKLYELFFRSFSSLKLSCLIRVLRTYNTYYKFNRYNT